MIQHFFVKLYFFLLIVIFFTSCKTEKNILFVGNDAVNNLNLPVFEIQKGGENSSNLQQFIKPGNELFLKNLQNETLISGVSAGLATSTVASGYVVETDSLVILPVIGSVKLGGLTRLEAEKKINALYEKLLLKNPLITLTVNNLQVTVLGEFSSQGVFQLKKEKTHLVEMIGQVGGLKPTANNTQLKIIRGNPQNPQILLVNLTDVNFMKDARVVLQSNDILYIAPKKSAQNVDKFAKTQVFVGIGLTLINTLFLIYNFTK